ncbi:hypothetical protein [Vibrio nigripulchritudo]|uniref:hypothetical protein n=1 Tax=Vibrio nigripulchritudo TaxID=28173 RepID=UPI00248FB817|nr:hypothetical protein [Vibrio nigripulchritudo]BDU39175.1 hypothetical protein TUMSATVNIG2_36440 [Vibrio nigripulchritudo]BDU44895.1 hypothetical protein TUMSATVNIG3_36930 [Vibrio nigripulchritudo]
MKTMFQFLLRLIVIAVIAPLSFQVMASDHRSPLDPPEIWREEARLTDLFFWKEEDHYIMALTFFRDVDRTENPDFSELTYYIHWDLDADVKFDSEFDNMLYGGTVENSENIKEDATISFKMNDDLTLKSWESEGLKNREGIEVFTGLRADPFIFPLTKGYNVMGFVVKIPVSSFPEDQRIFTLWANSILGDSHPHQVDHAGRALRTFQPRMQKLNFLPPHLHVEWIKTQPTYSNSNTEGIRPFDYHPDVVIYDSSRPAKYPNGRYIEDDLIPTLCEASDCVTYERTIIFGGWPRRTTPFKPFLSDFPYLAEPYEK